MPEAEHRGPRSKGDRRMYLYFDYSECGSLRWYVKVSSKGRRIGISEPTELRGSMPPMRLASRTRRNGPDAPG